jgi:hypothetical protein
VIFAVRTTTLLIAILLVEMFSPANSYAFPPVDEPMQVSLRINDGAQHIEVDTIVVHSPSGLKRALTWIKGRLPKSSSSAEKLISLGLRENSFQSPAFRDAITASQEISNETGARVSRETLEIDKVGTPDVEDLRGLMGRRYIITLTLSRAMISGSWTFYYVAIQAHGSWQSGLLAGLVAAAAPAVFTLTGGAMRDWFGAEQLAKLFGVSSHLPRESLNRFEQLIKLYLVAFHANGFLRAAEQIMSHSARFSIWKNLGDIAKTTGMDILSFWPWESFFTNYEKRNFQMIDDTPELTKKEKKLAKFYIRQRIDVNNWVVGILSTAVSVATLNGFPEASLGFGVIGLTGVGVNLWDTIKAAKQHAMTRYSCRSLYL